ncbi:MAG: acyl-CoA dehydrogenase family protein, partial [Pseudomonadota bacterium]
MFFSEAPWATDELNDLADGVAKFLDHEIVPHQKAFSDAGGVPREIWEKAGENGLLGISIPEEFGGL